MQKAKPRDLQRVGSGWKPSTHHAIKRIQIWVCLARPRSMAGIWPRRLAMFCVWQSCTGTTIAVLQDAPCVWHVEELLHRRAQSRRRWSGCIPARSSLDTPWARRHLITTTDRRNEELAEDVRHRVNASPTHLPLQTQMRNILHLLPSTRDTESNRRRPATHRPLTSAASAQRPRQSPRHKPCRSLCSLTLPCNSATLLATVRW